MSCSQKGHFFHFGEFHKFCPFTNFYIHLNSLLMRSTSLISIEKQAEVLTLSREGYCVKDIQNRTKVSRRSIGRILKRDAVQKERKYPNGTGRPRLISREKEIQIKRIVKRDKRATMSQIISKIGENVSKSTMSRIFKKNRLRRRKLRTKPLLSEAQKAKRVDFARDHCSSKYEWNKWIFSDEKKFNLDGPDGYRYYWCDLQSKDDQEIFSKDFNCRKSVMVWGAISKNGVSPLIECKTKQKGPDYIEVLEKGLIPIYDDGDVFQHDGASCHRAKVTKNFLKENSIVSPQWPAKSPDLNPIENIWGWMSRRVYAGKPAYPDLESLKHAIFQAWDEIPDELLDSLIDSMPKRLQEVIEKKGNPIKYRVPLFMVLL